MMPSCQSCKYFDTCHSLCEVNSHQEDFDDGPILISNIVSESDHCSNWRGVDEPLLTKFPKQQ